MKRVESTPPSIVTVTEVMNILQIDLMFVWLLGGKPSDDRAVSTTTV